MKSLLLFATAVLWTTACFAQSELEYYADPHEVRLFKEEVQQPTQEQQQFLRNHTAWNSFSEAFDNWYGVIDPLSQMPHRAWGAPLVTTGSDVCERAENVLTNQLNAFGVDMDQLGPCMVGTTAKHERAIFKQYVNGIEVLRSQIILKFFEDKLIMAGLDYFPNAELPEGDALSTEALKQFAAAGINLNDQVVESGDEFILPLESEEEYDFHLVEEIRVKGYDGTVWRNYKCYVDKHSGELLYRNNTVVHYGPEGDPTEPKKVMTMGMPQVISGNVQATVYPLSILDTPEEAAMPHFQFDVGGENVICDDEGNFITSVTGPLEAEFSLSGLWSTVFTNGVTPTWTATLDDGYNNINIDQGANVRERSAYKSTSDIHDHMKYWMPEFTGLDFSLTTNIDVVGECNAFYDGSSINFFNSGGGCNPTSLLADVVYHEYGHGINDFFYQSLGSNFNNGAMGEGYADFWGMSLTQSPLLGVGFYDDSSDPLRRYDIDPKIYPQDLVGQVHADGEIICGAWWDTHLLLGEDWDVTMPIFVEAYAGLQATTFNGNEGQAYTDVLLDALQADDDDGDLSNGTPNGLAIIEGFDMHGISLLSYVEIEHSPLESSLAETTITLSAEAEIVFPYSLYFNAVKAFYRTVPQGEWQVIEMTDMGNDIFEAELDGQATGTIIEYYLAIEDTFGSITGAIPSGADNEVYPNLPFFILVDVHPELINDSDDYADFGVWELGVPGDLATTGEWEEAWPVGSFGTPGDPSTIVAPDEDHTDGAVGYCFVTGNSSSPTGAIGENDVDGGHTTLESPAIDLTEYEDPLFTYWRWYANAPPSGANPGADWWQVEVSDDGGANWKYIENTTTQDISWRRNAFRISDHVDLTEEFKIRFIASDSIHIGQNLDGGSLIEGAVDDIILYDLGGGINVEENDVQSNATIWPNPSNGELNVSGLLPGSTATVFDTQGKIVARFRFSTGQKTISLQDLPAGVYSIRGTDDTNQPWSTSLIIE